VVTIELDIIKLKILKIVK